MGINSWRDSVALPFTYPCSHFTYQVLDSIPVPGTVCLYKSLALHIGSHVVAQITMSVLDFCL